MRAVMMRGGDLSLEEVPDPEPGAGQILIAPHATGICGSDLHVREVLAGMAAATPDAPPVAMVPGHEFAGEVVAIGAGTETDLQVGDAVTALPAAEGASGFQTIGLSPAHGGGLAEFVATDAIRTFRLPEGVDTRLGALTEPVAVAVHAAGLMAATGPIVVVGAGPVGLGIVAVAVADGRGPVVVVEPSADRRAAAVRLGADVVVEPGPTLRELLADVGFAASPASPFLVDDPAVATVVECVGRPEVVQQLVAEAPAHSRVVLAGACHQPVEVSPLHLTTSEITIVASFAYRLHEFTRAMELLAERPDVFDGFITSEQPLESAPAAFDALATDPTEIKILIRPQ